MSNQVQQLEMRVEAKGSALSDSPVGKIIVVDDEPELKSILVESLSAQGFEVTGCSSGRQALEELGQKEFDLLLTDLMMPEMDGIELLEEALKVDPHLLGIMMTGQGTIQTAVDAMKLGAFDYVLKPFRLQLLLPVLTRAINTRRLRMENLQLRETVAIYSLCQTISFTLEPQTVLSKLADAAVQQSDADEVSVLLPTSDGTELYVAAVRGHKRERLLGERIPLQQSISSWVARERTPLILNGAVQDDRFVALWPRSDIRSAVSVPMQVANKLVGVINLNVTNRLRPFTLGQMKALTILASTAAAALESASLYAQVQQAEKNYRSIFENAVEGIFQSTAEGRFLKMNPAMAQILGYASAEEAIEQITDIGQQIYVDPSVRSTFDQLQGEHGILQALEVEAYRKDGEKIWLSVNRRTIRDQDGNEIHHEGSVEDVTKRKRGEDEQARLNAEIKRQTERLNTIVATVPGIVFEVSGKPGAPNNKTNFVSEYIGPMLGYTVSEWLAVPGFWLSIVHSDDRQRMGQAAAADFAAGKNGEHEFRWIGKDGRVVWAQAHTIVVRDEDGESIGVRGVVTDITERKRVEEMQARRETHALFRADVGAALAVTHAPLRVTLELCAEAMVKHLHAAFARVWTLNREENVLELQASAGIYTHIDGAHARVPVGKFKIGKIAQERLPHITNDVQHDPRVGDHEWARQENMVAFAGYPLLVEDRLLGVMAMFSREKLTEDTLDALASVADVVSQGIERKRAERALRESEERYRDLVENAHDIIYEHDLQGNYTSTNKAGEHITGYTLEETLQLNIAQTVAPEYLEKAQEMFRRKVAGEKITAYELEIISKQGKRVAVEVNTRLVYENGSPVGVQGIARDVTERKQLEEQLRQSQKLEAIGQLAGGVAHDFNNLLTVIGGYSSILLGKCANDSPSRSGLEEIKKASDRASVLTRQLLAFSRKQILQPKILDLNLVVTDLEKMVRRLIGEDIDLLTITSPVLGKVKADPGQVEQVLLNLIVNARDAMPKGGKLTIETRNVVHSAEYGLRHEAQAGPYVMLTVSDTGCGMDPAVRPRIFEPFFTTKGSGKGTGLGLATVYGIVKQSGGNIWVYSEIGRGSTFKISLPRVDDISEDDDEVIAGAIPKGTELVLLVEDEEQVRAILQQILEAQGYRVLAASNGEEALLISKDLERDIKLMITDVVMPHMSGRELAEHVQLLRPTLPVIFMSGYTDDAIVRHGLLDEKLHFIQKPFDSATVARKVREVLDSIPS